MNDLETYFVNNKGNLIHKWQHYFEIYDRHFARYRGTDVHLLEIGIFQGGSLAMWQHYFGPKARIFGVDINPACKQFEEENIRIFIGDQADREFLRSLIREVPRIDILLDDGGHTMRQQINTFEELFPHVQSDGIYLCEDIHTSYWRHYGGGYHRRGTFIEYSKEFIDLIHAWHSEQRRKLKVTDFTRSVSGLHFYDSILVIEKAPREKPFDVKTGQPCIEMPKPPKSPLLKRIVNWVVGK